jgi:hypothetical protein
MVNVWISVEGSTEEIFVKTILSPHFSPMGIYLHVINMNGKVTLKRVSNEIKKLAYNPGYVTTMYDFYGFEGKDPREDKKSLENKIKSYIDPGISHRVFPHIQMYEFEGLLFSSPMLISNHVSATKPLTNVSSWAQDILNDFDNNPEAINDSWDTAPSKRLEKHTSYKKTIDGLNITKEIGLAEIRQKCVGFNAWVTLIESWRS